MLELLRETFYAVLLYLSRVFGAIRNSFAIDEPVLRMLSETPGAIGVMVGVVFVAGCSQLLGQSVVLLVNRVHPFRFLISLLLNGLLFVAGFWLTTLVIYLVGIALLPGQPTFGDVLRVVALSYGPLSLSFLVLIPYAGPLIGRVLILYSAFVAARIVAYAFETSLLRALGALSLGYLALLLLQHTLGHPFTALTSWVRDMIAGTVLDSSSREAIVRLGRLRDRVVRSQEARR